MTDMQKFPLRMKDNDLLVTELYKDPTLDHITAISVYLTPKTTSKYISYCMMTILLDKPIEQLENPHFKDLNNDKKKIIIITNIEIRKTNRKKKNKTITNHLLSCQHRTKRKKVKIPITNKNMS